MIDIRTVDAIRYVTPLREGGSLPAIMEADDEFLYVIKFRGAGQGRKALIAELIGGLVAGILGFRVPELVFVQLNEAFGRIEGDEEIQDLLKASTGLNLGLHYLSGAITFDPVATRVDATFASSVVWLDCLLMNVDRTFRNTNMLLWKRDIWLIDHGASLYFHHSWNDLDNASKPFPMIRDHVFLPLASELDQVNQTLQEKLSPSAIQSIVDAIPQDWLASENVFESTDANRNAYRIFLEERLKQADKFIKEAQYARKSLI
jgi:hypothetical protein